MIGRVCEQERGRGERKRGRGRERGRGGGVREKERENALSSCIGQLSIRIQFNILDHLQSNLTEIAMTTGVVGQNDITPGN
jgi:hypothetical protein